MVVSADLMTPTQAVVKAELTVVQRKIEQLKKGQHIEKTKIYGLNRVLFFVFSLTPKICKKGSLCAKKRIRRFQMRMALIIKNIKKSVSGQFDGITSRNQKLLIVHSLPFIRNTRVINLRILMPTILLKPVSLPFFFLCRKKGR